MASTGALLKMIGLKTTQLFCNSDAHQNHRYVGMLFCSTTSCTGGCFFPPGDHSTETILCGDPNTQPSKLLSTSSNEFVDSKRGSGISPVTT